VVYYSPEQSVNDLIIKQQSLDIFSNPASSVTITIRLHSDHLCTIEIFDQTGRNVKSIQAENSSLLNVDISALPDGFYSVKTLQDEIIYTQKLIIK